MPRRRNFRRFKRKNFRRRSTYRRYKRKSGSISKIPYFMPKSCIRRLEWHSHIYLPLRGADINSAQYHAFALHNLNNVDQRPNDRYPTGYVNLMQYYKYFQVLGVRATLNVKNNTAVTSPQVSVCGMTLSHTNLIGGETTGSDVVPKQYIQTVPDMKRRSKMVQIASNEAKTIRMNVSMKKGIQVSSATEGLTLRGQFGVEPRTHLYLLVWTYANGTNTGPIEGDLHLEFVIKFSDLHLLSSPQNFFIEVTGPDNVVIPQVGQTGLDPSIYDVSFNDTY